MKIILLLPILGFAVGTLWAQDAPAPEPAAPAAPADPAPAAPAAAEPAAAEEVSEARWSDFLPLNKEMAGDADLPLPFGIGVVILNQKQDMLTDSISVTAINPIVAAIDVAEVIGNPADPTVSTTLSMTADRVESDVDAKLIRLDAWVLPFLNVYGIAGSVEGDNKVINATHTSAAVTAAMANFPAITYEGDVLGIGGILAFARNNWWVTLDYSYTEADLTISTSEIITKTFTPRIGTVGELGDLSGTIWIGGMQQKVDEHQIGTAPFPPATVDYDVMQHAREEWNFLVGASVNLSEELNVAMEAGFGDREQFMGTLTLRF